MAYNFVRTGVIDIETLPHLSTKKKLSVIAYQKLVGTSNILPVCCLIDSNVV